MSEYLQRYLKSTRYINYDAPEIADLIDRLGLRSDPPTLAAVKAFRFVRDQIKYNPYAPMLTKQDYEATTVLERGHGFCVQKAILLAALSRGAGIPCKLIFADIISHQVPLELLELMRTNRFTWHGYNAMYLDGRWVKATASFDIDMCERMGFVPVGFDGTADAVLPAVNKAGMPHIEYVKSHGDFDDVPYDEIVGAFKETYVKGNPKIQAFLAEQELKMNRGEG